MEEAPPSLSLSPPKRPHKAKNTKLRGGRDPPIKLRTGQAVLRILCHVDTAGGVIGSYGTIVNQLERDTGARICFSDTIPTCRERVIHVIGYAAVNKKMSVDGDEEKWKVSQVQEALIRVFERVLQVEGTGGGVIGCRLLAGIGQIGAVMGRGGKIVNEIRESTGAKVCFLPKDQLPECASPGDELIQLIGGIVAIKKALVAVARRLQVKPPMERAPVDVSAHRAFPDPHAVLLPHQFPFLGPLPGKSVDYSSTNHSLSADTDSILNPDEECTRQKVLFRLLCSARTVGGVIGKGGAIVKDLENETGASIKLTEPVAESKERVAIISALENPDPLYSPAQIALIRVFARSIKVGSEKQSNGKTITARLLVASKQGSCLLDEGGELVSDIRTISGVEIQLLEWNLVSNCTSKNDKVVQISGAYENVKSALFQVTGRLRDNLVPSMVSDGAEARHYTYSAVPASSPYGREKTTCPGLDHLSGLFPLDQEVNLTQEMDHLGFLHELGGPDSPRLQPLLTKDRENITSLSDTVGGLTTFGGGHEQGSLEPAVVTNRTVEFVIPEKDFASVYGENGRNLARLKQISGATVIVQDPCPGECDVKVITSGTLVQIQVAQSLLQAFILPEQ